MILGTLLELARGRGRRAAIPSALDELIAKLAPPRREPAPEPDPPPLGIVAGQLHWLARGRPFTIVCAPIHYFCPCALPTTAVALVENDEGVIQAIGVCPQHADAIRTLQRTRMRRLE